MLDNAEANLEKLRSVQNPNLNLLDDSRIFAAEHDAGQVEVVLEAFGECLQLP